MAYRQYDLQRGNEVMTCWLNDTRIKEGLGVTLKKGPEGVWWVVRAYDTTSEAPPEHRWDVGGIT
jgi:hypothetical protein